MPSKEAEREYQREYYRANRAKRSRVNRWRWRNDPRFRQRERDRRAKHRALKRAETADTKFDEAVAKKREEAVPTNKPQLAWVNGRIIMVWSSGSLAREVGRSARSIRTWLREGYLPGATVYVHGVAWFSRRFAIAVYRACKRLYYLDGRTKRSVLRRLVLEELEKMNVSYVPLGGDNVRDRVHPAA